MKWSQPSKTSQTKSSQQRLPGNTHLKNCPKTAKIANDTMINPSNDHLKTLAGKYERNTQNNNVFNGKNISDHTRASEFQQIKTRPELADQLNHTAQQSRRQQAALFRDIGNTNVDGQPVFTNNMLNQYYDDNASIKVSKMPSNLVEVPRVNEKYEIKSFFGGSHPTYQVDGLKTMQMMNNQGKDPILNLNPSFFGKQSQDNKTSDPYSEIYKLQKDYQPSTQANAYLKDFIYRTDFDHPLSFHNQTLHPTYNPPMQVNFPPLVSEQTMKNTTLVQNGFYSKEPLTLNLNTDLNAIKNLSMQPYQPFVYTLDERMIPMTGKENFNGGNVFQQNENMLYQPNVDILNDIDFKQKERDLHNYASQKSLQDQLQNQKISELSPGGTQRQIPLRDRRASSKNGVNQQSKDSQMSMGPRIEDQYNDVGSDIKSDNNLNTNPSEKRPILSIRMRDDGEEEQSPIGKDSGLKNFDYQSSPDQYDQEDHLMGVQMQPRGLNMFNQGGDTINSKYVDKYPLMDEQCRKDLPLQTQDSKKTIQGTTSPYKSVRFNDDKHNQNPYINNNNLVKSGGSDDNALIDSDFNPTSSNKQNKRSKNSSSSKRHADDKRGGRSPDSEDEDDYDDEEDEESEEEDESDDDEVLDQELQNKIEKIKNNLGNTGSSAPNPNSNSNNTNNQEDTINKLEEVLKRQRDRLENMTLTNKSNQGAGYQTQGSQNMNGSELTQNFEFTKSSPMDTVKTTNRLGTQPNLEKAYEELEREIHEIKSKLQQSLGASINNDSNSNNKGYNSLSQTYGTKQSNQQQQQPLLSGSKHQQPSMRSTLGPQQNNNSNHFNPSQSNGRSGSQYKSPNGGNGDNMEEHDYSLSVSDLGNSMYNSSRGPGIMSNGGHHGMQSNYNNQNNNIDFNASNGSGLNPPKFKY
eukprot:403366738